MSINHKSKKHQNKRGQRVEEGKREVSLGCLRRRKERECNEGREEGEGPG